MQGEPTPVSESEHRELPVAIRVKQSPKPRRPPRPTRETPRTQLLLPNTRAGWLKVTGISLSIVLTLGISLFGLRLLTASDCQEFSADRTAVTIEGFGIEVQPSDLVGSFGVKLSWLQERNDAVQLALDSLPPTLAPVSPPVMIQTCSVDPRLSTLRMRIPDALADQAELDLYGWYERTKTWGWLGAERVPGAQEVVARVPRLPSLAVMVKVAPIAPMIGAEMPPIADDSAVPASTIPPYVSEIYAIGKYLNDKGGLSGEANKLFRPNGNPVRVIPIVRNWGVYGDVKQTPLKAMLSSEDRIAIHADAIMKLVDSNDLAGVAIDYRGVEAAQREAFVQLITLLGEQLNKRGKPLFVAVPAPAGRPDAPGQFDAGGYDLRRIGDAASRVLLDLTTRPEVLYGDALDALIRWATGQVDRHKLQVVIPTLSVQKDALERVRLLGFSEALGELGPLQPLRSAVPPGESLRLWWRERKIAPTDVFYAERGSALSFMLLSKRGVQQTTWLNTAASLKETLTRVRQHNIRGIVLRGLTHPDHDAVVAPFISRFAQGSIAALPVPEPVLKVAFGDGTPFSVPLAGVPRGLRVQAPGGEGEYQMTTTFQSVRTVALGSAQVRVSSDAPASADEEAPTNDAAQSAGGVQFELGGHVNDLVHAVQMQSAGMTWARTEVRDEVVPEAFINTAKQKGFKVLITAVGDRNRVMSMSYREQWTQFLAKLAAAGADAIQVWHEPNYQLEWPAGQIGGATYADLLKRAYFAIKQVNPNVMVISAGLAQTSGVYGGGCSKEGCDELAFLRQMANQNAQDYMDCVGVNYTSGSDAPGVIQNNRHYLHSFEPLRNAYRSAFNGARPLCFTALGYITKEGIADRLPEAYAFATNITLSDQATWLGEAVRMAKASGQVRLMIIWNVDATTWIPDDPATNTPGDPQAGYAMIRPDGTCPACETLRSVLK